MYGTNITCLGNTFDQVCRQLTLDATVKEKHAVSCHWTFKCRQTCSSNNLHQMDRRIYFDHVETINMVKHKSESH